MSSSFWVHSIFLVITCIYLPCTGADRCTIKINRSIIQALRNHSVRLSASMKEIYGVQWQSEINKRDKKLI
ncbi:hypothetical protein CPB84DRAFT_1780592 [Gymnopilus junonius]|uniref:Uncharacterized protein n=1 Tax=Gymnopilus junonius TaxID=109634 RepID=A0A9P5TMQ8_GYMJU|nr:hypothetical protein CPB84DRAFT_1780592 [Gymnopilus junonius]